MKINPYGPNQVNNPVSGIPSKSIPTNQSVPNENEQSGNIGGIGKVKPPSLNPNENLDTLKSIYSEKELKKLGIIECQTCANRTYVDGSDDPGVSFKTPTQIDPEQSASAVMGHELEHVANEQADAHAEGREIISQSVKLHTAICPECGISYVSGGVTETVSKKKTDYGLSDELTKGLKIDGRG